MTVTATPNETVTSGDTHAASPLRRAVLGQSAADVWGKRRRAAGISLVLLIIGAISLSTRWFDFGVDFEGGVVYDVPAGAFDEADARSVLDANDISGGDAKVDERTTLAGEFVKVRVVGTPEDGGDAVRAALAEKAGVATEDVNVSTLSARWGDEATITGVIAGGAFLGAVMLGVLARYGWRAAVSALAGLAHDLVIVGGIYSLFGFEVTPAAVAVLLGIGVFSLYDKVVVFERFRDNAPRMTAAGMGGADLLNVSVNQLAPRSIVTSVVTALPVFLLLVIGWITLGQSTVRDSALALFLGLVVAAFSSLFVTAPLLSFLMGARGSGTWLTGEDLRHVVVRGVGVLGHRTSRRKTARTPRIAADDEVGTLLDNDPDSAASPRPGAAKPTQVSDVEATTEQLLSHPPRPRKKKRH